jgi:hypothetical protein
MPPLTSGSHLFYGWREQRAKKIPNLHAQPKPKAIRSSASGVNLKYLRYGLHRKMIIMMIIIIIIIIIIIRAHNNNNNNNDINHDINNDINNNSNNNNNNNNNKAV